MNPLNCTRSGLRADEIVDFRSLRSTHCRILGRRIPVLPYQLFEAAQVFGCRVQQTCDQLLPVEATDLAILADDPTELIEACAELMRNPGRQLSDGLVAEKSSGSRHPT
jgi:hypothetical protein